jgi:PAS domain-containing protein
VEAIQTIMPKQSDRALREADAGRQSDKASNHLLLAAREQYRLLVQNVHGVIYEILPDGVFGFVSSGWTRLLGHDVSDVVDHDFRTFVHPDDVAACEVFLQKAVATGEALKYPLKNVKKMNVLSHIGQSYIGKGETMSQDAVERLLGRLITDEHFRQMAVDSLFMACQQTGFLLSSTEMELLSGVRH